MHIHQRKFIYVCTYIHQCSEYIRPSKAAFSSLSDVTRRQSLERLGAYVCMYVRTYVCIYTYTRRNIYIIHAIT
jgi:hypothetical protein